MMATVLLTLVCGFIAGELHHQLGVAPILGAILCAACFLRPWELFLVGMGGILVRDSLIGFSAFTLVRLLGIGLVVASILMVKVRPNLRSILTALVVSSPIFHLVLAVGDWWTGTCAILPKTPQGLFASIAGATPYFLRSFIADTLFASFFLGAYTAAAYALLGARGHVFSKNA